MTPEQIRDEYHELMSDIRSWEDRIDRAESRLDQLWKLCPHTNRGKGEDFQGFQVSPNECPDCGHCKED